MVIMIELPVQNERGGMTDNRGQKNRLEYKATFKQQRTSFIRFLLTYVCLLVCLFVWMHECLRVGGVFVSAFLKVWRGLGVVMPYARLPSFRRVSPSLQRYP